MCGRYTSTSTATQVAAFFAAEEIKTEELPLRYNVAPSQQVYAIAERRPREEGEEPVRQLGAFKWGLVPSWAKDPSIGNRMINARAEGIATKSAYKRALARRRCIIPADAFYEWQVREVDGKRRKAPYVIKHKDGSPLAFAGLWEVWHDAEDEVLRTCVIITTDANKVLAPIHDRMPVILPPKVWDQWLDPENDDVNGLQKLLVPAPAREFEAYEVTTRVNNVRNDGPELIAAAVRSGQVGPAVMSASRFRLGGNPA
jgi:putative SOS response-associated peptidase YedK